MARYKTGFDVFVMHRRKKLTLGRGFATAAEALAFAEELRRVRFRGDGQEVFVVDGATGRTLTTSDSTGGAMVAPDDDGDGAEPATSASRGLAELLRAAEEHVFIAEREVVALRRALDDLRDALAPPPESARLEPGSMLAKTSAPTSDHALPAAVATGSREPSAS